jgi:hypothetical protein
MFGLQPMPTLPIFWLARGIWLFFLTTPKYWFTQRAPDSTVYFLPTHGRLEDAQIVCQKIGSPARLL